MTITMYVVYGIAAVSVTAFVITLMRMLFLIGVQPIVDKVRQASVDRHRSISHYCECSECGGVNVTTYGDETHMMWCNDCGVTQ